MMIFERLRRAIKENRIKQAVIADRMGVTPSYLSRILAGERRLTAADFLSVCLVLGEDPAEYMDCDELATTRLRVERAKEAKQNG